MTSAVDIGQAVATIVIGAAAAVSAIRADRSARRTETHVGGNGMGNLMTLVEGTSTRLTHIEATLDAADERLENVERRVVITADRVEAWADRQTDHLAWHQAGQPERRTRKPAAKAGE